MKWFAESRLGVPEDDRQSMERIYKEYCPVMEWAVLRTLSNACRSEAPDVIHSVFLSLVSTQRLEGGDIRNLKAYLVWSVIHEAGRINKEYSKEHGKLRELGPEAGTVHERTPFEAILVTEEGELVKAAMDKLPKEQRDVIVARCDCGLTFREIALASGMKIRTVQSRYKYGIKKLRTLLNGESREDPQRSEAVAVQYATALQP